MLQGNFVSKITALLLPVKESKSSELTISPTPYDPENFQLWKVIYFPCVEENDSAAVRALYFSYHLLQDLILGQSVPGEVKEPAYDALKNNVLTPNNKYAVVYNRMMSRLEIMNYDGFESVADDLCGLTDSDDELANERMSWSRMVSIFTFALCLAHKYRGDEDRVEEVSRYLAKYLINNTLDFVRRSGGWDDIAEKLQVAEPENLDWMEFVAEDKKDSSITTIVLWSGICVGSVATTMFLLYRKS